MRSLVKALSIRHSFVVACPANCYSCSKSNPSTCLTCASGTYLYNGLCISSCGLGFVPSPYLPTEGLIGRQCGCEYPFDFLIFVDLFKLPLTSILASATQILLVSFSLDRIAQEERLLLPAGSIHRGDLLSTRIHILGSSWVTCSIVWAGQCVQDLVSRECASSARHNYCLRRQRALLYRSHLFDSLRFKLSQLYHQCHLQDVLQQSVPEGFR